MVRILWQAVEKGLGRERDSPWDMGTVQNVCQVHATQYQPYTWAPCECQHVHGTHVTIRVHICLSYQSSLGCNPCFAQVMGPHPLLWPLPLPGTGPQGDGIVFPLKADSLRTELL